MGKILAARHRGTDFFVLVYWLLQGKRGALLAMIYTTLLLTSTRFAQTVDLTILDW